MDSVMLFAKTTWPLLNAVLTKLDPEAFTLLAPHEHKILCFQIENMRPLYFQISTDGLQVIEPIAEQPIAVTFAGPLSSFINMVFTQNRVNADLHIKGDIECAKALYDTWHFVELDWEGQLANWVGPQVAQGLSLGLQSARQWAQETFAARSEDLAAYMQDETQCLPHQSEVDDLFKDIDTLRNDVARFQAKLTLFQQRLATE